MVTPSATSPQLTDAKKKHMIFRTIGRDDQQGPVAAQYIIDKVKPKKVAVLHDKQSYGEGIATAVETGPGGGQASTVVIFEGINEGDSDFSARDHQAEVRKASISSTSAATTRNSACSAPGGRTRT